MDENEDSKMKSTGTLQWSKEDRTYVTTFGAEKPRGGSVLFVSILTSRRTVSTKGGARIGGL